MPQLKTSHLIFFLRQAWQAFGALRMILTMVGKEIVMVLLSKGGASLARDKPSTDHMARISVRPAKGGGLVAVELSNSPAQGKRGPSASN